jgi:hypothetical protein
MCAVPAQYRACLELGFHNAITSRLRERQTLFDLAGSFRNLAEIRTRLIAQPTASHFRLLVDSNLGVYVISDLEQKIEDVRSWNRKSLASW